MSENNGANQKFWKAVKKLAIWLGIGLAIGLQQVITHSVISKRDHQAVQVLSAQHEVTSTAISILQQKVDSLSNDNATLIADNATLKQQNEDCNRLRAIDHRDLEDIKRMFGVKIIDDLKKRHKASIEGGIPSDLPEE